MSVDNIQVWLKSDKITLTVHEHIYLRHRSLNGVLCEVRAKAEETGDALK